jgi:hypothetical protein
MSVARTGRGRALVRWYATDGLRWTCARARTHPQAALVETKDEKGVSQVRVQVDKKEYVLCTLRPGRVDQVTLNTFFSEGERVSFNVTGNQYGGWA